MVFNIVQDLLSLMKKLPLYCNNFLEMINRILTEYYDACYNSYKGTLNLDMNTAIRWRLLSLYKDIFVIVLHSIAAII